MKIGFRIDIQSDLNDKEINIAKNFSNRFIINTLKDAKKRYDGMKSGGDTPYKRGTCISLGEGLNFRRINRHKRIFGVSKMNTLDEKCEYGKLKFKNNIPPTMFIYAQIGDIKG